nr:MAG TPA: Arv1-like family protein [Caudoviricetes sp.]
MKDKLNRLIKANINRDLLVITYTDDDRISLCDYVITTCHSVADKYVEDIEALFEAGILSKDDITYLLLEDYDAFGEILEDALNKL